MARVVTIFGSSRPLPGSDEYKEAERLGRMLASAGFTVCNGGYGGTMEAAARGAREAGGHTIGVIATVFANKANQWVEKEVKAGTLVERLMKLIELGDAYVVLQGGTGTLLELAAVWEFINKGMMETKPIVVVGHFWNPIVDAVKKQLRREGSTASAAGVMQVGSAEECVMDLEKLLAR